MNNIGKLAAGGWVERVKIMKAMEAASAELLESHPGPNIENARTPMAAQPIWAMNTLYFLAPGEDGVANRTAQTAPKGAIVIETPLGANIWSIFPNNAIAAKAPAEGQRMSLREGAEEAFSGVQPSQNGAAPTLLDATTIPYLLLCLPTTSFLPAVFAVVIRPREFFLLNRNGLVGEENDSKDVDNHECDDVVCAGE